MRGDGLLQEKRSIEIVLFKKYLGKIKQVISPHRPSMSTRVFAVGIFNVVFIKLRQHKLTIFIGYILFTSHGDPKLFEATIDQI